MIKGMSVHEGVKVKLSPAGIETLKQKYKNKNNFFSLRVDKDGYYHSLLWKLMNDFGPSMGYGEASPFIGDILSLEGEKND